MWNWTGVLRIVDLAKAAQIELQIKIDSLLYFYQLYKKHHSIKKQLRLP